MNRRKTLKPAPLRITLRQVQIFAAVARAGSTSAAAEEIALSQSATSAALLELESVLGGRLFDRAGRGLVLNEHGRSLLPRALALVDGAHALESEFGRTGRAAAPRLRLAASTTTGNYLLPGLIGTYRKKVPLASFSLEIANTRHVAEAVAGFEADIGFIEGPTTDEPLTVIPWIEDELVIVASPRHPLAGRGRATVAELRESTWLLREPGSGTREVVEAALRPRLRQLRSDLELGSTEAIKAAAAEGIGLTCLSRHAIHDLVGLGRLVVLRTQLPPMRRMLSIIHHEHRHLSPTLATFMAFCRSTTGKTGRS